MPLFANTRWKGVVPSVRSQSWWPTAKLSSKPPHFADAAGGNRPLRIFRDKVEAEHWLLRQDVRRR